MLRKCSVLALHVWCCWSMEAYFIIVTGVIFSGWCEFFQIECIVCLIVVFASLLHEYVHCVSSPSLL